MDSAPLGVEVPIPILGYPADDPTENKGAFVVEVAMLHALNTSLPIVEVADFW